MADLSSSSHQGGHTVSGPVTTGVGFVGSNIHGSTINIAAATEKLDKRTCMEGLFVCIQDDEREKIMTREKMRPNVDVCRWVTEANEYRAWHDRGSGSQLMWIQGGAGTGKTMLSIYLSQHLEQLYPSSRDQLVVYHFCGHLTQEHNSPVCILRHLIWKMCQKWDHLYDRHVREDFLMQSNNLFRRNSDSAIQALWRVFVSMLKSLPGTTIYLVVDGIDSLSHDERELIYLLQKITAHFNPTMDATDSADPSRRKNMRSTTWATTSTPAQEAPCAVKFLLLGRETPFGSIRQELDDCRRLDLDRTKNEIYGQAIRAYVQMLLDETADQAVSAEQRQAVLHAFDQRQDTSFITVQQLFERIGGKDIVETPNVVMEFPKDLQTTYLRALEAIPAVFRDRAAFLMRRVLVSFAPLTMDDMLDVIRNTTDLKTQQAFDRSGLHSVLEICAAFVNFDQNEIWFQHASAADFLLSTTWRNDDTSHLDMFYFDAPVLHAELAQDCIRHLTDETILKESINLNKPVARQLSLLKQRPFLNYAIKWWPEHAQLGQVPPDAYDPSFFDPTSKPLVKWWESYCMTNAKKGWAWLVPRNYNLLHLAAHFGLLGLAQNLERRELVDSMLVNRDSHGMQPLHYAIRHQHLSLVEFLIQQGAPISDESITASTYLHIAACYGSVDVVDSILRCADLSVDHTRSEISGAQAGTWFFKYARGVAHVYFNQDDKVMSDLTNIGGKLLTLGGDVRPLHIAALGGHQDLFRYLLAKGASPTAPVSSGHTPLHIAASEGHVAMVQLLLEDYNGLEATRSVTTDGWTPLHAAAYSGRAEVVDYLLTQRSDPNVGCKKAKTPLHLATQHAKDEAEETVRLLLESGAKVDAVDHKGRTPLLNAQERYLVPVVQILIDSGADPKLILRNGKTVYKRARKASQYDILAIFDHGPRAMKERQAEESSDPLLHQVHEFFVLLQNEIRPACQSFIRRSSITSSDRNEMRAQLASRVNAEIISPLDGLQVPEESSADIIRKEIMSQCQKILEELDKSLVDDQSSKDTPDILAVSTPSLTPSDSVVSSQGGFFAATPPTIDQPFMPSAEVSSTSTSPIVEATAPPTTRTKSSPFLPSTDFFSSRTSPRSPALNASPPQASRPTFLTKAFQSTGSIPKKGSRFSLRPMRSKQSLSQIGNPPSPPA